MSDNEPGVIAPHDAGAEDDVLGALLYGNPRTVTAVREILEPSHFFRETNGTIFRVICELADKDIPSDPTTTCAELDRQKVLDSVGGNARLHALAALLPAASNATFYASIVREKARDRRAFQLAQGIVQAALNGGVGHADVENLFEQLDRVRYDTAGGVLPIQGMTHAELMAEVPEPTPAFLIDELLEPGIVATIAGVPETYKSWLAAMMAILVAKGTGEVLGRKVTDQGAVGYIWQDDSTRNELARGQLLAKVHSTPPELPLTWFLNEGVMLPESIPRLRATIEQKELVLLVMDSFYNVAGGIDLKDTDAGRIIAQVKRDLADPTGCTILFVDHMAWATQDNRGRLHAYGDVFKNAATRAGIYIDVRGKDHFLEARGNNIKGIPKTRVEWDPERLELVLQAEEHVDAETYRQRVLSFVSEFPWSSRTMITGPDGASGNTTALRDAIDALVEDGEIEKADPHAVGLTGRSARGIRYAIAGSEKVATTIFDDNEPPPPEE